MFSEPDQQQFWDKGIPPKLVEEQLAIFRRGVPFTILDRPCTIGNGITCLSSSELDYYANLFHQAELSGRVTKFVPASGAASRMFKTLLAYWNAASSLTQDDCGNSVPSGSDQNECHHFFSKMTSFAFFDDLAAEVSKQGLKLSHLLQAHQYGPILKHLLFSPGLNYARLPKGLIKFHRYPQHTRTPIEEHIFEGLAYAKDSTNTVHLHFTVSPEHQELVEQYLSAFGSHFDPNTAFLDMTCSQQKSSSDTLAVDLQNQPFRGNNGRLVFRPGGHGALLENLSNLQGDIVFIKNIDNVVHDRLIDTTTRYKKALGGYLISVQEKLFSHLRILMRDEFTAEHCRNMMTFTQEVLGLSNPDEFTNWSRQQQKTFFLRQFNRPIRVCGMVSNTGEPGGGPFWVKHSNGSLSLQIVESSQVDPHSSEQQAIWRSSTHFNPVDLVCGLKDFQGKAFNLKDFSDPDTGTISRKSHEGRDLKALELPGLWNGAMANWNTLFIEVPHITFNPVKTIFDLLRPEHQPARSAGQV
ncbi:MAG: DUF4301 family protein [Nitrospirota bacterium]|nr:MAG: DUF4301 family protein [Nitrospirota bacterium]